MRDMRDLVRRLAGEGITILLSSHLLNEVEDLCNRVAIIRKGSIVYEGPLQELLATAATSYRLRATDPERARMVLLAQQGIDGVSLGEGQLRFTADEEAVARAAIALGQARIGITALIPETASLEELFLGLTGGEPGTGHRDGGATHLRGRARAPVGRPERRSARSLHPRHRSGDAVRRPLLHVDLGIPTHHGARRR